MLENYAGIRFREKNNLFLEFTLNGLSFMVSLFKVIQCFAETGQFQKIVLYAKKVSIIDRY